MSEVCRLGERQTDRQTDREADKQTDERRTRSTHFDSNFSAGMHEVSLTLRLEAFHTKSGDFFPQHPDHSPTELWAEEGRIAALDSEDGF